jgi:hypothetical protein
MTALPANVDVDVSSARLPETYENAKNALANCASIDECQEWANRAEALASYAKQADDDTLRKHAERIQARAVRRVGELLKLIEPSQGGRPKNSGSARPSLEGWVPGGGDQQPSIDGWVPTSRKEAADAAGISEHRRKQSLRVANVPDDDFEQAVEGDDPPTVTKLAERGRQPRDPQPTQRERDAEQAPQGFREATHLIGTVKRFAEFCRANDPERVASGVMPSEAADLQQHVSAIDGWLDRFVVNLKGE